MEQQLMIRFSASPFAIFLSIFGFLSGLILYGTELDIPLRDGLLVLAALPADGWQIITNIGHGAVQLILCLFGALTEYLRKNTFQMKKWLWAIPVFLFAGLIGQIIKRLIGRPRPSNFPDLYDFQWWEHASRLNSFPSGHTITTFALVAFIIPSYPKARIPLLILAAISGLSRVMVHAHWPADVLFGGCLGYAIGISIHYLQKPRLPTL